MSEAEMKETLDRLVDTRPVHCRGHKYDFARLDPHETVSIVLSFHGSTFYDLKLALRSIVEHTPYDLYTEIVVLDDGTADETIRKHANSFLQDPLYNKVGAVLGNNSLHVKRAKTCIRYRPSGTRIVVPRWELAQHCHIYCTFLPAIMQRRRLPPIIAVKVAIRFLEQGEDESLSLLEH